jgi:outer membrane protein assembly factor BamE (lipoprotein component of BamABCDE complex)
MRAFLLSLTVLGLCGCQIIYKLPTRQGNVYDQKDLSLIKPGMTRDQVRFVLGTPIATNPFRSERWDYVSYYKSPRGEITSRTVSLYFDKDVLERTEGLEDPKKKDELSTPDSESIKRQEALEKVEAERAKDRADKQSGINLPPDAQ